METFLSLALHPHVLGKVTINVSLWQVTDTNSGLNSIYIYFVVGGAGRAGHWVIWAAQRGWSSSRGTQGVPGLARWPCRILGEALIDGPETPTNLVAGLASVL